jgi:hypothetical protein
MKRGGPPAWGLGERLTTLHCNKPTRYEMLHRASNWGWEGSCAHDNEPSSFIKAEEFLDYLSDCQLLKKDSAPWS